MVELTCWQGEGGWGLVSNVLTRALPVVAVVDAGLDDGVDL